MARLAHIRAVLAARLSLEASPAYVDGRALWRSERRIRAAIGGRLPAGHVPDAEVSWPDVAGSAYAGECWAVEAELTPKPLARTAAIMAGLLARASDYYPAAPPQAGPRYHRIVYLVTLPHRLTDLPPSIRHRLYQALDLEILYNKPDNQATFRAVITTSTPTAAAALIHDSEPPTHPTSSDSLWTPMRGTN